MERAEFVASDGPSWWLYDAEIEIRIDEARRELGVALGTTEREWYNEANRRQELFDFLQTNGPQLLVDLDTLYNDEETIAVGPGRGEAGGSACSACIGRG